jgi:hypothetical protein
MIALKKVAEACAVSTISTVVVLTCASQRRAQKFCPDLQSSTVLYMRRKSSPVAQSFFRVRHFAFITAKVCLNEIKREELAEKRELIFHRRK